MNCIKPLAFLLWLALLCPLAKAQIDCSFDADQQELISQDSSYYWQYHQHANYVNWFRRNVTLNQTYSQQGASTQALTCRRTVFTIPVVFHVMYDPAVPATNVSDTLIEAQLELLNAAFANAMNSTHPNAANTQIQFCMAQKDPSGASFSGVNRVSYTGTHIKPNGVQKAALAASAYYNPQRYLNIWIVKDIQGTNGSSQNIGGYSNINYTQGIDGVVMRYDFMGDYAYCNSCFNSQSKGLALVHEIGHYLGLYHTFHGGCTGGVNSTNCNTQGDLCCDTRPCQQTFDCPTGSTVPDCPSLPFYGTADDNRNNHMSYADQTCKNNFTQNQAEIMQAVLLGSRRGLIDPQNINDLALGCCHTTAFFTATNTFLCEPDTVRFTAVQQTGASYRWVITSGGTTVLDSTLSTHLLNYYANTQGFYNVQLSVIKGTDTTAVIRNRFVERANCGTNLASTQGNWYFGKYAGLRFTTVGAVRDLRAYFAPPPTINTGEGCIAQSDSNGNLMFYAGGDSARQPYFRIYKPSVGGHTQVNTSNLMKGHSSSTQGGIVLPFTNDTNKYHLVVTGGNNYQPNESSSSGGRYNIIDKTNSNLVISANRAIAPPPGDNPKSGDSTIDCSEYLTAIPRCGGGYWLILKENRSNSLHEHKLVVYSVTDAGITYHSLSNETVSRNTYGQMKASPDGNFVSCPGSIFRFNTSTGMLTLFRTYDLDSTGSTDYYGCSFSPNSKVLYVTRATFFPDYYSRVIQYDLLSSNDSLSKLELPIFESFAYINSMQLAPDSNIYITNNGSPQLIVINNPNNLNSALNPNNCGLSIEGPMLQNSAGEGGISLLGLPNMVDAKAPNQFPLDFYHVDSNCRTVKFYPNKYCDSVSIWRFGDGDSSTNQFPIHTYATNDSFTVRMVMRNGDSAVKRIRIGIDNPIIQGDTFVTCSESQQYVYTVSNQRDNLNYSWSANAGSVTDVNNQNNAFLTWNGVNAALYVEAVDSKTGCRAIDTLPISRGKTPDSDTLWVDTLPCIESLPFTLKANKYSGFTYLWSYSKDSTNWTTVSGQYADTLITTLNNDSLYFRRYRYNYNCGSFSKTAVVKPFIYISSQPQNSNSCKGIEHGFGITIENQIGASISYQWQYLSGSTWINSYTTSSFIEGVTPADSTKYRCIIGTACGSIYSDTALVLVDTIPTITTQPISHTVNEEDSTIFSVAAQSYTPIQYQWYSSADNGSSWTSMVGDTTDTLVVRNVSMCMDKYRYRAEISNSCSSNFGSSVSNQATLTVNKTRFADLWWRDNYIDGGAEPTLDSNGIWNSPDIWVRNSATLDTNHQNPNYNPTDSNYVFFRIRNRGIDTSLGGELYLYWTKLAMGERWDIDWTTNSSNVRVNQCSGVNYLSTFPMGGEINTTPIQIPPIAPGGEYINKVKWLAPNPYWYCVKQKILGIRVSLTPDSVDVCLLGRIVTCQQDSFGLTRKEVQNIKPNVYHNNNIVTKNLKVTNLNQIVRTPPPTWVGVRNPDASVTCSDIRLPANTGFSSAGDVIIHLDEDLLSSWQSGGLSGSGFTMIDSSILKVIPNQTFVLSNICLTGDQYANIGVQFSLDSTYSYSSEEKYHFTIGQYAPQTTNILGAVNFDVNLTMEGQDSTEEHIDSLDFSVVPNPVSDNIVTASITMNFSTSSGLLYVYDNWGNMLIGPNSLGDLNSGEQTRTVDISELSAGTYTMVIAANSLSVSQVFIITN